MNGLLVSVCVGVLALVALVAKQHVFVVDIEPVFPNRVAVFGLTKQIDNLANRYLGLADGGAKKDFPDGWNRPAVFRNGVNTKKWLAPKVFGSAAFWVKEMQKVPMVGYDNDRGVFSYFKMDRPLSRFLAEKSPPKSSPRRNMTGSEFFRLWNSSEAEDERIAYSEVLHKLHIGSGASHDELIWPLVYPWWGLVVSLFLLFFDTPCRGISGTTFW